MAKPPATSSSPRIALGGLLAGAAAIGVGRFVYTPILPAMSHALGLTTGDAGWIAAANYIGYLAGALAAGHPRLSRNARLWLVCALAASSLSTLAMGLASGFWAFIALRAVGGVASAFVLVYASALVLRRLAETGREALSAMHFAGVGVGLTGSAALVSLMTAAGADWRGLWIGSGVVALAASLFAAALIPAAAPPPPKAQARTPAAGLARLLWAYGLFGFGYVITATFLVALVRAAPAARPLEPYVWLIVGLTAIPSVALWDWVARRLGIGRAFALACVLEAGGVALSVLEPNLWGAALAAALLGGTYMGITALGLQGARTRSSDPPKALALMTAGFSLGQIVGPIFAGQLAQFAGGLTIPSLAAAAALLVSAGLTFRLPGP
jgi:predicted MFS family arabinose efflux permease